MKLIPNLSVILILLTLSLAAKGQVLDITLDANQLQNADCWLNQGSVADDKVYIHAGACSSGSSACTAGIAPSGSTSWEHVIGNWGMDDGVGLMNYAGNGIWNIQIDVQNYFASAGFPSGGTAHVIGLVFRSKDGTYTAKDDQCGDIFIVDINTGSPKAIQGTTQIPFAPVTVSVATSAPEPQKVKGFSLFPNPSKGSFQMAYETGNRIEQLRVSVFNTLGQEVATLFNGVQNPGEHQFNWETDQSGMYYVILRDGSEVLLSEKVLVQN